MNVSTYQAFSFGIFDMVVVKVSLLNEYIE
jgi:hypothetical protein